MCNLNADQRNQVRKMVTIFTRASLPFTGHDIAREIHGISTTEVGTYLREKFNKRDMLMATYACTQVVPKLGPVLYLPVWSTSNAAKSALKTPHGQIVDIPGYAIHAGGYHVSTENVVNDLCGRHEIFRLDDVEEFVRKIDRGRSAGFILKTVWSMFICGDMPGYACATISNSNPKTPLVFFPISRKSAIAKRIIQIRRNLPPKFRTKLADVFGKSVVNVGFKR